MRYQATVYVQVQVTDPKTNQVADRQKVVSKFIPKGDNLAEAMANTHTVLGELTSEQRASISQVKVAQVPDVAQKVRFNFPGEGEPGEAVKASGKGGKSK